MSELETQANDAEALAEVAAAKTTSVTAFTRARPPAALFYYSRDRRGEHPETHLASYNGILQADAYAGYNALFKPERSQGAMTRALCWAHARRHFFELADTLARINDIPQSITVTILWRTRRAVSGFSSQIATSASRTCGLSTSLTAMSPKYGNA